MSIKPILAAAKSLQLALRQSFVLKEQCIVLREAILLLDGDVKANPEFYESKEKLSAQILRFLKRFLRFARINLKVTEARSKGLGDLRKARSLCNVNKLCETLNGFSADLQLLVMSSQIQKNIGVELGNLLSGLNLANAYNKDKAQLLVLFKVVFEGLLKIPGLSETKGLLQSFVLPLTEQDPFDVSMEDLDSPRLADFSFKLEQRLLGMTTQDPTPFKALKLDTLYRQGKFGEIYRGTLGGPVPVCIQKIKPEKLQTLSSDGRIKLFSTVRTNLVKGHDNIVKVIGVTLHEDTMYVSLQNVHFSLSDLLHGFDGHPPSEFTPNDLLYIFHCIASALEFLQKDGVIHGDMTPKNIFLSREAQQGSVRLANFSYELNLEELHWSTWNDESIEYQAPEVLQRKIFSAASDIYALGICIWESTQDDKRPFANIDKNHIVERVNAGERPEFSASTREASWLVDIANRCWHPSAWHRPEVSLIREEFEKTAESMGKDLEQVGDFVAPLVKKVQQQLSESKNRKEVRRIPEIKGGPAPLSSESPRPLLRSPIDRKVPAVPSPGAMGSGRRLPAPPPIGNTRPLPAKPGSARPLPPRQDGPPSPPRPLPRTPDMRRSPGRPLPPVQQNSQMSPPRPLPRSPPRPVPSKPDLPVRNRPLPQPDEKNMSGTLNRVDREYNDAVPQPQATGVNGLTAQEVRQQLIRFYEENDPDMLNELNSLVNWCMVNGLEQFEKLLVERFGKGLPMFSGEESEEEEAISQQTPKSKVGLASIFTRRGAKRQGPSKPPGLFRA